MKIILYYQIAPILFMFSFFTGGCVSTYTLGTAVVPHLEKAGDWDLMVDVRNLQISSAITKDLAVNLYAHYKKGIVDFWVLDTELGVSKRLETAVGAYNIPLSPSVRMAIWGGGGFGDLKTYFYSDRKRIYDQRVPLRRLFVQPSLTYTFTPPVHWVRWKNYGLLSDLIARATLSLEVAQIRAGDAQQDCDPVLNSYCTPVEKGGSFIHTETAFTLKIGNNRRGVFGQIKTSDRLGTDPYEYQEELTKTWNPLLIQGGLYLNFGR